MDFGLLVCFFKYIFNVFSTLSSFVPVLLSVSLWTKKYVVMHISATFIVISCRERIFCNWFFCLLSKFDHIFSGSCILFGCIWVLKLGNGRLHQGLSMVFGIVANRFLCPLFPFTTHYQINAWLLLCQDIYKKLLIYTTISK